jgi:gas vesicle protein
MTRKDFTKHRLLEALGLEERSSAFSVLMGALGTFALGALVGAGVGLLSAPKPGRELRSKLRKQLGRQMEELEHRIS